MSPDWLGNPHHVVAGVLLAALIAAVGRRWLARPLAALLAVSMTMTAEALVEVVEWPLLYGTDATAAAYYDTIADIVATFFGALVGAAVGVTLPRERGRASRRGQRVRNSSRSSG